MAVQNNAVSGCRLSGNGNVARNRDVGFQADNPADMKINNSVSLADCLTERAWSGIIQICNDICLPTAATARECAKSFRPRKRGKRRCHSKQPRREHGAEHYGAYTEEFFQCQRHSRIQNQSIHIRTNNLSRPPFANHAKRLECCVFRRFASRSKIAIPSKHKALWRIWFVCYRLAASY